ncbi:MAG: aminotransferase class IV [Chloroflexota bacterium]
MRNEIGLICLGPDGDVVYDRARLSAVDRGFTLGDGVFETMVASEEHIAFWDRHMGRLRAGLEVLRLPIPWSDAELADASNEALNIGGYKAATVRLSITRGVATSRGLVPPPSGRPRAIVEVRPFKPYPPALYERGLRLATVAIRRNDQSPLSRIKSLCYLDNVLARLSAETNGSDDALLLNTRGFVACSSASNVFLVTDHQLTTPDAGSGALGGITRSAIAEVATRGQAWDFVEAQVAPSELWQAQEVFLTNSLWGVMPVTSVDGRAIGRGVPGTAVEILSASLDRLRGFSPRRAANSAGALGV